jgi:hypothetical protein
MTPEVIATTTWPNDAGGMTTTTRSTSTHTNVLTLRNVLLLDAVPTGVNGLAFVAGATVLDTLLGPSPAILVGLGIFMLAYAATAAVLGTRRPVNRLAVGLIADGNIVWALASALVLVFGWLELTTAGAVWTLVQAALVAGFAALQMSALRRTTSRR